MAPVRELLDSTLLFLARHEEVLTTAPPGRALEACESLHSGLCTTLAAQIGAAHNELGARAAPEPASPAAFAEGLARPHEPREREAWALASLRKRMAETEGVLLHLRLTLAKGSADGPALTPYLRRLHAESLAAQRALDALRGALRSWAEAYERAAGAPRPAPLAAPPDPRAMVRAAREALAAGVPRAAAPLLREALRAAAPSPLEAEALRAVERRLDEGVEDAVLAWRLLDFVEYALNVAGLPRTALAGGARPSLDVSADTLSARSG